MHFLCNCIVWVDNCEKTFIIGAVLHVSGQAKVAQFHTVYRRHQHVPSSYVPARESKHHFKAIKVELKGHDFIRASLSYSTYCESEEMWGDISKNLFGRQRTGKSLLKRGSVVTVTERDKLTCAQSVYSPGRRALCWADRRTGSMMLNPSRTSVLAKRSATGTGVEKWIQTRQEMLKSRLAWQASPRKEKEEKQFPVFSNESLICETLWGKVFCGCW